MTPKFVRVRNRGQLVTMQAAALAMLGTVMAQAQSLPQEKPAAAATQEATEEIIELSPFEVNSSKDTGYQATETLAGTRIRTELRDVGSAISVVTKEFMEDIGATDTSTLLQYTTNAEVSGTRGTYGGLGNGQTLYESANSIGTNNRVRGLSAVDNTRDFYSTSIPWDAYNVDRIDIQRGPNSILFGLGSPAGIVNAATRNAEFKNKGSAEFRVASYGSSRASLDVNHELIKDVLSLRVDGLWSNEKYQQKPAFQKDKRIYGALRFDPKLFGKDFKTSIRVKAEKGDIKANKPRTATPYDNLTPWFVSTADGGAGKISIGETAADTYSLYDLGSSANLTNPWVSTTGSQQTAFFLTEGSTGVISNVTGGYINNGFLNANGSVRGVGDNALGQRYAEQYARLSNYQTYAQYSKQSYWQYAQYKNKMLTDSSVFDFYNNLIDGDNKGATARWTNYNIDLTQNAWGDRVGLNLTYNYEKYDNDSWTVLGTAPTIDVDITRTLQDGTTNSNYGRPYIASVAGGGTGNWGTTEREAMRASLFAEGRASDIFDNKFLVKLLGRHRLNGVISEDTYNTESRDFNLYANSNSWNTFLTKSTNKAFNYNSPLSYIFLGSSLANATTASGANLQRIESDIQMRDSGVYLFDSTWNAASTVTPGAAWTPTGRLTEVFNSTATTQASNPANYKGWSNDRYLDLLSHREGDSLYTAANRKEQKVTSYAGTWQGFLWNESIVPTIGWRYDSVKMRSVNALADSSKNNYLKLDEANFSLPDWDSGSKKVNFYKSHSTAGGVVLHINKAVPMSWDNYIPLNVSLSYNDSSNVKVDTPRVDVFGAPIGNQSGKTKEYGVLLSTKDNRFSFRAIKYETTIKDATASTSTNFHGAINYGLQFRNVFLYKLSSYNWDSRAAQNAGSTATFNGQTVIYNTRHYWTPAYVDANGRPVATIYAGSSMYPADAAAPAGSHLETQAEAIKHRDDSIDAWNNIQAWLTDKGFFQAWNYGAGPTTPSALTNRSTFEATGTVNAAGIVENAAYTPDSASMWQYGGSAPTGFAITEDQESEGYEFEATANITKNWRLAFNAAKTTAISSNVGSGAISEFYNYIDAQMDGVAGDMRRWNGDFRDGNELRDAWTSFETDWNLLMLREKVTSSELRKWRFNIITNYSFTEGWMKGIGIGAAYRWQDRIVIGYPIIADASGTPSYDLSSPVYGPREDGLDFWVSYKRKLTDKIDWKIQLNVRDAFENEGLIPVNIQSDGTTYAGFRIKPVQEWSLTNTFSF